MAWNGIWRLEFPLALAGLAALRFGPSWSVHQDTTPSQGTTEVEGFEVVESFFSAGAGGTGNSPDRTHSPLLSPDDA